MILKHLCQGPLGSLAVNARWRPWTVWPESADLNPQNTIGTSENDQEKRETHWQAKFKRRHLKMYTDRRHFKIKRHLYFYFGCGIEKTMIFWDTRRKDANIQTLPLQKDSNWFFMQNYIFFLHLSELGICTAFSRLIPSAHRFPRTDWTQSPNLPLKCLDVMMKHFVWPWTILKTSQTTEINEEHHRRSSEIYKWTLETPANIFCIAKCMIQFQAE